MRKLLLSALLMAACSFGACASGGAEYNSNPSTNGTLSTATTVAFDKVVASKLDAPAGTNEDWYAFEVRENGFVQLNFFVEEPKHLLFDVSLLDSFGRPLDSVTTNASEQTYVFDKREMEPDRYFISVATNMGKEYGDEDCKGVSPYTVSVHFEVPPPPEPEPQEVEPEPEQKAEKCVPADKCKAGQKCCKPKKAPAPAAVEETVVTGNIVSITPQAGGKVVVKISGIGTKKGVRKGATGKLQGSSLTAYIYSCAENACQATIEASSDEVKRYKSVDVVVK